MTIAKTTTTFCPDSNTWDRLDGRLYETGIVFDGPVQFEDRACHGMYFRTAIGRWAYAERLDGVTRITSEFKETK